MLDEFMQGFASAREVNLMRIKEAKENGAKVVGIYCTYCTYCPQELILAAGAIPVGLCGMSEIPIAAAEEILPRNLCPFFHFSDFIVGETTCDGKKNMFEIMQDLKPIHVMQLPHVNNTKASFDLWVEELESLKVRIEAMLEMVEK